MVIAIDPEITNPITNKKEKASEYFGFSLESSVSSLKKYLEQGSNNILKVKVTDTIYIKEFPKYEGFESMTEEQFHELFPVNANGKGEWYGWWKRNQENNVIPLELDASMYFDYSYLINKCNLIEKRNAGQFDMVWVFGIDPLSMHESVMIGKTPFG